MRVLNAERGEVHAVDAVGLAADPRGEEVVAGEVAERGQWRGVAGEVEVELAVGQVPVGAGKPCGRREPTLVAFGSSKVGPTELSSRIEVSIAWGSR